MATPVIMPKQGQSVESCIITQWHKKKGDRVKVGDPLFSYETDKASFEEEATVDGLLLDVFFEEGDDVPCLVNVCVIGEKGESTAEYNPNISGDAPEDSGTEEEEEAEVPVGAATPESPSAPQLDAESTASGRNFISPRAKNRAQRIGVDYRFARGTGPHGRIIERDIIALEESGMVFTPSAMDEQIKAGAGNIIEGTGLGGRITTEDIKRSRYSTLPGKAPEGAVGVVESDYEEVELSNIRKVIAKAMHHSLSSTAQLTLNSSFDASCILDFRKKLKASAEGLGLENITLNDIIIYAVSRTLLNHRELNAHLLDDKMLLFKDANIGVAVDTPRGLMVPTLFGANRMSLNEIARETKRLAAECQSGAINPDFLKGAGFTVTNLGTLGIESFTPVLNPPQTGILGVNTIVQRARQVDDGYEFYPAMGLSLTFDHRAVDGAPAARFLKELSYNLENFTVLLAR